MPKSNSNEMATLSQSQYLRVGDAAKYLAVSQSTLNHMRTAGGGPRFAKLGAGRNSRIIYRTVDLTAWVESRTFLNTVAAQEHSATASATVGGK